RSGDDRDQFRVSETPVEVRHGDRHNPGLGVEGSRQAKRTRLERTGGVFRRIARSLGCQNEVLSSGEMTRGSFDEGPKPLGAGLRGDVRLGSVDRDVPQTLVVGLMPVLTGAAAAYDANTGIAVVLV